MTVNMTLYGTQHDYNALLSALQQHKWPQQTLTSGPESFVVRQRGISGDFSAYTFCITVPDDEVKTFRHTMYRSDLMGFQHSLAKVEAKGPSGENLIYL